MMSPRFDIAMLGSWFHRDNSKVDLDPRSTEGPPNLNERSHPQDPSKSTERTVTYPPTSDFSTPHDAILEGLYKPHVQDNVNFAPNTDHDSKYARAESEAHNPYSLASPAEVLYDPFTGAISGSIIPTVNRDNSTVPDASEEKEKEELLWSHLSKILDLQSKIATMHVDMEGIVNPKSNADPTRRQTQPGFSAGTQPIRRDTETVGLGITLGRKASESIGVGEDVGDEFHEEAEDEEAEANKVREEEFASLADKFKGRKQAVDEIMDQLGELSQALTTFHNLRTPILEFSRQNSINPGHESQQASKDLEPRTPTPVRSSSTRMASPPRIIAPPTQRADTSPVSPSLQQLNYQDPFNPLRRDSLDRSPPTTPHRRKPAMVPLSTDSDFGKGIKLFDSPTSMNVHARLPPP